MLSVVQRFLLVKNKEKKSWYIYISFISFVYFVCGGRSLSIIMNVLAIPISFVQIHCSVFVYLVVIDQHCFGGSNLNAQSLFCICITGLVCPIWWWHVAGYRCLGKNKIACLLKSMCAWNLLIRLWVVDLYGVMNLIRCILQA